MHFIRIKEDYLDYLKQSETRIPNQDYGENRYKPFYILCELSHDSEVLYVTQITSPKQRHVAMNNSVDFFKLRDPNGKFIGATNMNYMFPVLPEYIEHLTFNDIKEIVLEDYKVSRLSYYKKAIEKINLKDKFEKLYTLRYERPDINVSKRCLDFKKLEATMLEFKLREQFYNDNIKVERSEDYSTFFVQTNMKSYVYPDSILSDLYDFLDDMSENLQLEETLKNEAYLAL